MICHGRIAAIYKKIAVGGGEEAREAAAPFDVIVRGVLCNVVHQQCTDCDGEGGLLLC